MTSGNTVLGANLTYDSLFESERGFKPKEVESKRERERRETLT